MRHALAFDGAFIVDAPPRFPDLASSLSYSPPTEAKAAFSSSAVLYDGDVNTESADRRGSLRICHAEQVQPPAFDTEWELSTLIVAAQYCISMSCSPLYQGGELLRAMVERGYRRVGVVPSQLQASSSSAEETGTSTSRQSLPSEQVDACVFGWSCRDSEALAVAPLKSASLLSGWRSRDAHVISVTMTRSERQSQSSGWRCVLYSPQTKEMPLR